MKIQGPSNHGFLTPTRLGEYVPLALFAYISFVPFYYLEPIALGAQVPSFVFLKYLPLLLVAFLAGLWLIGLRQYRQPVRRLAAVPWGALYLTISLLSLCGAAYPGIGLVKWGYYHATGILFGWILAQSLDSQYAVHRLVRGVALVAGVCATYTLLSHWLGKDWLWDEIKRQNNPYYGGTWRATAPFGNAISTASYMSLCCPFICWEAWRRGPLLRRAAFATLALMALMVTLLSQSRGGWLAIGTATLVAGLALAWQGCRRQPWGRVAVVALVALLALPVAWQLLQSTGLHRIFAPQIVYMEHRASLLSGSKLGQTEHFRLAQFDNVIEILSQHPFLGIGFGNFTRYFEDHRPTMFPGDQNSPFHTTDNMYLMFAAETGILGLVAAVALLAAILWRVGSTWRQLQGADRGLSLAFMSGASGFLANMVTWDPLNDPTLRLTFWMLAGVALALPTFTSTGPTGTTDG